MTASADLFSWLRGLPRDSRLHQVPMGEEKSLWEIALDVIEAVEEYANGDEARGLVKMDVTLDVFFAAAEKERV